MADSELRLKLGAEHGGGLRRGFTRIGLLGRFWRCIAKRLSGQKIAAKMFNHESHEFTRKGQRRRAALG
jgi:hypothetical protein